MLHKTRAISEGAMMLAIIGIVLLLNRQSANFFEALLYFVSIPIVVYSARYSYHMGIVVSVSACILGFLFSTLTTQVYLLFALSAGIMYAYGLEKQWKNAYLLFSQIGMQFILTIISVVLFASLFGYSMQEEVDMMQKILPTSESVTYYIWISVALSYVIISVLQAIVVHVGSLMMLKRLRLVSRELKPLTQIRMPKGVAYFTIISILIISGSEYMQVDPIIKQIGFIVFSFSSLLCMANGVLALLCRYRCKGFLKITILFIACFLPIVKEGMIVIGIYDMFYSLRQ